MAINHELLSQAGDSGSDEAVINKEPAFGGDFRKTLPRIQLAVVLCLSDIHLTQASPVSVTSPPEEAFIVESSFLGLFCLVAAIGIEVASRFLAKYKGLIPVHGTMMGVKAFLWCTVRSDPAPVTSLAEM